MYKIDKSTWDKMSSNKSKIIKQWMPEPHVVHKVEEPKKDEILEVEKKPEVVEVSNVDVEEEVSKILKKAQAEAEQIKKAAYEEGLELGFKKANEKFQQVNEKQKADLQEILKKIEIDKNQIISHFEKETLNLSLVIAEKILNIKLDSDDKVFVGMVKNTLDMIEQDEPLILRLSSDEYEKHYREKSEALLEELQCDAQLTVVKDASLKPGSLIVESESGFVDAGVATQLGRVAESLTQSDSQYHEVL